MGRTPKPIRTWLAASAALAGVAFAPASLAGDIRKSGAEGADAKQVEALSELLRQAEELQKSAKPGQAAVPAKADEDAAAKAEDEAVEKIEKKPVVRAGCMYSGTKLIWEKVPGTCQK